MQKLVECVPNFSNGRQPDIYNQIADTIRAVPEVKMLDVSADPDHNRTVISFVGSPKGTEEAAFAAIQMAARLINLDHHTGEHPRLGATDVFPFIPIRGVSRQECVDMAHRVGKRVGEDLGIAVYMYGEAATKPGNRKLSDIRSGEYEQWKREIGQNKDRDPDYGPAEPKPWGATVIGVRPFLVAYNIFLNSNEVKVARQIARNIRESSHGLRNIQAKGFLVDGQAQISMNILNFEDTPIHRVQELVRVEAKYYGLTITKSELIGLSPQKAFMDAARWYLQAHDLRDDQILEYRLLDIKENASDDFTPYQYLDATAANTPTPAGGSASALVGALAASLTQMVAGVTVGKKAYEAVRAEAQSILDDAVDLRHQLTTAIMEDSAAFDGFLTARRQSGSDSQAVDQAWLQIVEVPFKVAQLSRDVVLLATSIAEIGNRNAVADAATAAILARAAAQTAVLNVRFNTRDLPDHLQSNKWKDEIEQLEQQINRLVEKVHQIAAKRGGA